MIAKVNRTSSFATILTSSQKNKKNCFKLKYIFLPIKKRNVCQILISRRLWPKRVTNLCQNTDCTATSVKNMGSQHGCFFRIFLKQGKIAYGVVCVKRSLHNAHWRGLNAGRNSSGDGIEPWLELHKILAAPWSTAEKCGKSRGLERSERLPAALAFRSPLAKKNPAARTQSTY